MKEAIKDYVKGLGHVVLGTGIVTIIDWFGGRSIDHPFDDIAIGSGMAGGHNIGKGKAAGVAASLTALAGSVAPYVLEYTQNGDLKYLGINIGIKAAEYSIGAVIGYIFSDDGKPKPKGEEKKGTLII